MNVNFAWYKHNATYYDLFDADVVPYDAISKAIEKVLKKYRVKTMIDLGCGTGNFYLPFAKLGFQLLGVDISPDMINVASTKIIANNLEPNLIQSDIRKPLKDEAFDAAICLYNVIGDLNYQDFSKVVRNMARTVRDNGLICFDVINFDNVKSFEFRNKYFIEKECESKELEKLIRRTKQKLDRQEQSLEVSQYTTVDGKTDEKSISRCKMYLYTVDQVISLLNKNGLKTLLLYGSYDDIQGVIPFKPNDPIIGVIAQKSKLYPK